MPTRLFPKGILEEVVWEGDVDLLRRIEQGEWIDEGKYSFRETIVQAKDTGKFYAINESRSGSHFTGWYYSWEDEDDLMELVEVRRIEKVVSVWEKVGPLEGS